MWHVNKGKRMGESNIEIVRAAPTRHHFSGYTMPYWVYNEKKTFISMSSIIHNHPRFGFMNSDPSHFNQFHFVVILDRIY